MSYKVKSLIAGAALAATLPVQAQNVPETEVFQIYTQSVVDGVTALASAEINKQIKIRQEQALADAQRVAAEAEKECVRTVAKEHLGPSADVLTYVRTIDDLTPVAVAQKISGTMIGFSFVGTEMTKLPAKKSAQPSNVFVTSGFDNGDRNPMATTVRFNDVHVTPTEVPINERYIKLYAERAFATSVVKCLTASASPA